MYIVTMFIFALDSPKLNPLHQLYVECDIDWLFIFIAINILNTQWFSLYQVCVRLAMGDTVFRSFISNIPKFSKITLN